MSTPLTARFTSSGRVTAEVDDERTRRSEVKVNPFPYAQEACAEKNEPYCPFYGLACRDQVWCPEKQAGFCGQEEE